jgi:hypothetical protein
MDMIKTIDAIFEKMYDDVCIILQKNDDTIYNVLMNTKKSILCASAANPMNINSISESLTPKTYEKRGN